MTTDPKPKSSLLQSPVILIGLVLVCIAGGVFLYFQKGDEDPYAQSKLIEFKTGLTSNAQPTTEFKDLVLKSVEGKDVTLQSHFEKNNLIFVVLRGYAGSICPYCSAQTQRLVTNYDEIKKAGADVLIAYPIESDDDTKFAKQLVKQATYGIKIENLPLTFAVDVNLKVVDQLGIRADLS